MHSWSCSCHSASRYVDAIAESAFRIQQENLNDMARYAWVMVESEQAFPVAAIRHECYGETPLRVRIAFQSGDKGGVAQVGKVFVSQSQIRLLLKKRSGEVPEFLVIHIHAPVALRATDRATAKGIAAFLDSVWTPPPHLEETFGVKIRLAESDGLAANMRCERLLAVKNPQWRGHPQWRGLQLLCCASRALHC